MPFKWIFILFFVIFLMTKTCQTEDDPSIFNKILPYSWMKTFKLFRNDIKNCLITNGSIQFNKTTWGNCLKVTTLKIFDDIMSSNIITLMDGVKLVKILSSNRNNVPSDKNQKKTHSYDKSLIKLINQKNDKRKDGTWLQHIRNKIIATLSTHVLQISIMDMENTDYSNWSTISGRHRRHRNNMMMAMMFGVTAMGAIIVPVGFQLLSVISGKALLLAKMALLLASINGLKKIASSGIHYGLYQVADNYGGGGYYDRNEQNPQAFSSKNI